MNTDVLEKNPIVFQFRQSGSGGYEAQAIGFSIFTQGESLEELTTNVRDAIICHFGSERAFELHKSEIVTRNS